MACVSNASFSRKYIKQIMSPGLMYISHQSAIKTPHFKRRPSFSILSNRRSEYPCQMALNPGTDLVRAEIEGVFEIYPLCILNLLYIMLDKVMGWIYLYEEDVSIVSCNMNPTSSSRPFITGFINYVLSYSETHISSTMTAKC